TARYVTIPELRGLHLRRLRERNREVLHDALQLQGVGTPAEGHEQGMDWSESIGGGHRACARQRHTRTRGCQLGPELDVQVSAPGRYGRALRAHAPICREQPA